MPTTRSRPSTRTSGARASIARLLARLHEIRHLFGPAVRAEKLALVSQLQRHRLTRAAHLRHFHDDLLFLRAFGDDLAVQTAAARALERTAARVRSLSASERRRLDDSGMAGTTTRHTFAFGITQWLAERGEDAEVDWNAFADETRLDPLLRLTLTQAEGDAFDSGEIGTRDWLTLARGAARSGALHWLQHEGPAGAHRARRAGNEQARRLLYDAIELPVAWRPSASTSTSGCVVPGVVPVARRGMRRPPADVTAHIQTPLTAIKRLAPTRGAVWVDACRAALSARCREVHAITYANAAEVYLADLGEGTALCIVGAARDDRLTLEVNYGYVLFANGIPIGYGGVTPLASQANTGINIFDPFRHGEAAMLYAQSLRAFRTLFGTTRFVVNAYQFGADNDEALASGAYWFYDRLGFRPGDPAVRALADRERAQLARRRSHRSSARTLQRLASGDLVLELGGADDVPLFDERHLITLARAVTAAIAAPDRGARELRRAALLDAAASAMERPRWRGEGGALRFGMERLGPVLALIAPAIARWSRDDREALVRIVRAKGGAEERNFAQLSRQHRALWQALTTHAASCAPHAPARA